MYSNLLKILSKKFSKVYFVCTDDIKNNLEFDSSKITYNVNNNPRQEVVFRESFHMANKCDYLITDEYYGLFFRVYNITFSCRYKFIIIHNINKWTSSLINPFMYPKNFIDLFFRDKFLNQFDYFITNSPVLSNTLSKKSPKKIFVIPFNFNNSEKKILKEKTLSKINILIPGVVDQKRRDYITLLKNLFIYFESYPNSNIQIELLGKLRNNSKIISLINKVNNKKRNAIIYYTKFIDDEKFNDRIMKSQIIFSNLKKNINKQGINEVYGLTKESGISFIIAKYSKPAILPKWQKVFSQNEDQIIKYNRLSEICDIFTMIESNKEFIRTLKNNAVINKNKISILYREEELKFENFLETI